MALILYKDASATQPLSQGTMTNPDEIRGDATTGLQADARLWIKSDNTEYTYRNITITAEGDSNEINMLYCTDNNGSPSGNWQESLVLPDGDYSTPYPIWRRLAVEPQTEPVSISTIKHKVTASVYFKD